MPLTSGRGSTIDPKIRLTVEEELASIERDEDLRVLFAVESGSRAWGFPSRDSDYDVRFVYVRPTAAYLSIRPGRDVVERPITDALDISGWDARKALQLMCKSNPTLIEWLTSPIRYRSLGEWPSRFLELARAICHLPTLGHHYSRVVRRNFNPENAAQTVRIKAYCYAVRAAMDVHWIRSRAEAPPMNLAALMEKLELTNEVRETVNRLVLQKADACESDEIERVPILDRYIAGMLDGESLGTDKAAPHPPALERVDALFLSLVCGQGP